MKKRKKGRSRHFTGTSQQSSHQRTIQMEPEELVPYMHRAEKNVLPMIKELELSPGAAAFLLAQHVQILVTGDQRLSPESAMAIANTTLTLWQTGLYTPSPDYPYTLEETLQEVQGGMKAKKDYTDCFQPFMPMKQETARGIGTVVAGIVEHPKTHLWQIWVLDDGPCTYFGAYHDPLVAQAGLEEIIMYARKGATAIEIATLYHKLLTQGDGEPQQLPMDMMVYLLDHQHLYQIQL
jgi:hypothetical protein